VFAKFGKISVYIVACGSCGMRMLPELFVRLFVVIQVEGSKLLNIPLIVTEQVDKSLIKCCA